MQLTTSIVRTRYSSERNNLFYRCGISTVTESYAFHIHTIIIALSITFWFQPFFGLYHFILPLINTEHSRVVVPLSIRLAEPPASSSNVYFNSLCVGTIMFIVTKYVRSYLCYLFRNIIPTLVFGFFYD